MGARVQTTEALSTQFEQARSDLKAQIKITRKKSGEKNGIQHKKIINLKLEIIKTCYLTLYAKIVNEKDA